MTLFDWMDRHEFITMFLVLQAILTAGYVGDLLATALGRRGRKGTP